MRKNPAPPKKVALASHPSLPEAIGEVKEFSRILQENGVEASSYESIYDHDLADCLEKGTFDLAIAVGGDGTMLRASHVFAPHGIPILGINMGRFGFLTEFSRSKWRESLPQLLRGEYQLEERMMLHAGHWRGEQCLQTWNVLNEVVVCRGQIVRPIHLEAAVDGYHLAAYIADGMIVAAPTGSTAYALAVGGPIMPPELRNILMIPVAPHLSVDRGVILPEEADVKITVRTGHQAVLSADGQTHVVMEDGDSVQVQAGDHTALFVRFNDPGYFYRNLMMYMGKNPVTGNTS
jgi:NAD+ kinase